MNEESRNLLRIGEVSKRTTISKPHIYTLIRQGKFPKPIKLTANTSVWLESDIDSWIDSRIDEQGVA
ncbi:MAG: AlpA family transcriptional regulator [Pseudomonadota bacterium]|nr:AlpA family transcriptional regulator [Pseudomonadota bacterium]